jgi:glycosyltransferase involved in cell wall biosynthesis
MLQLGYTSSSVWNFMIPSATKVVTNMDGLEWKRTKYGKATQRFLKYAEKVAVRRSDFLVADSIGIQKYLKEKYGAGSRFIPYGANLFSNPDAGALEPFGLRPGNYDMLIARLEPENNIEMILEGVEKATATRRMLVIANHLTKYGSYLKKKFGSSEKIWFYGPLYEMRALNNLRYFSNLYFHGHSVGGTNPSLLEAMASHALIAASRNEFNASVLEKDAYYFESADDVRRLVESIDKNEGEAQKIQSNIEKIKTKYSWPIIIGAYADYFEEVVKSGRP